MVQYILKVSDKILHFFLMRIFQNGIANNFLLAENETDFTVFLETT